VALVQACQDARRAHRNWFASLAERRKGRRVGPPRFKSRKDRRQSVRLTRNGFALRPNGRVYVAKVGDLRVEWSRLLPSAPWSCTVIREADGRYYVSFVVKRDPVRLPPVEGEVGIDLGLDRLVVTLNDEVVARSVHDAGWSTLVRLIVEKAESYGRTVVKVGRGFPSSQLCSRCGHRDGPKPLAVRAWSCEGCGAEHDRDLNAARNVLTEGRRIAAGLAEIQNASLSGHKTGFGPAVCVEAGTRLGTLA
jgi:putative transposase